MLDTVKKHMRSFRRDYWQHAARETSGLTLQREMAAYSTVFVEAITAASFGLPPAIPVFAALGAGENGKKTAERNSAVVAAVAQVQNGITAPVTVKRIRLKVAA